MEQDLLEFPCRFPLKVMGANEADFAAHTRRLVSRHAARPPDDAVSTRPSRNGRYLSVTLSVQVDSRSQLDAIYRSLSGDPRVLMVL